MVEAYFEDLSHDITCIDTGYQRQGLAACYLIRAGDVAAFIDTGTYYTVAPLLRLLKRKGIVPEQVAFVMPTHVHLDHAGGAGALLEVLPRARLVVHPRGARHMINPEQLQVSATAVYGEAVFQKNFGQLISVPQERVITADDGFILGFNGRRLLFLDTPGHARHHYSIYDEESRGFFCGDAFGLSYRELDGPYGAFIFPTTTPVQFDPKAWHETLDRYLEFEPERMYLAHYGPVSDIARLTQELHKGIDELTDVARSANGHPNRHQRILDNMTNLLLRKLRSMHSPVSDEQGKVLFAMDLELNAQGLEVWLDRND